MAQSSSQASLSITSPGTKIEMQRESGDTGCVAAGGRSALPDTQIQGCKA